MQIFGDPEEFREAQQKALEEYKRKHLEASDRIKELLTNLNNKDMATLRKVFHTIAAADDSGQMLAVYFEGQAHALLVHVRDVCPNCGINHTEEFVEGVLDSVCDPLDPLDHIMPPNIEDGLP